MMGKREECPSYEGLLQRRSASTVVLFYNNAHLAQGNISCPPQLMAHIGKRLRKEESKK